MKKNLKYISVFILILIMNSCFINPINEAPKCSLGVETEYKTKEPVIIYKTCKKTINNYLWKLKIDAPTGSNHKIEILENGSKRFIPDIPGRYIVYSEIKDEYGAVDSDRKIINIKNNAPTAIITSLTSSQYYTVNTDIFLSGKLSSDDDGVITKYEWSFKKVPEGSNLFSMSIDEWNIQFSPDISGEYIALLRVTDNNQTSSYASYSFYVNPNSAPIIQSTSPDYNLELIEVAKDERENFTVELIDDNTKYTSLRFNWSISINNGAFEKVYDGFSFNLNGTNYAIGDLLNLKLEVSDRFNATTVINWNIIIIN